MQKYSKPKYDYKTLGINPCVSSLVIPVNDLQMKNQYKKSGDELLPLIVEAETTPFTKIYAKPEHRKLISNLSPSAKALFLWVMYELETGEDALWINKQRFMKENKTSLNTFKKSLAELIRYAFIVNSVVKEVYWINPEFFFRGNRISKYPKNVVKS